MRKLVKWTGIAICVCAVAVGAFLWLTQYGLQPWGIVPATVLVDGKPSNLIVGRSSPDIGAVALIWPDTGDAYTIEPAKGIVGRPNRGVYRIAFGRIWPKPGSAFFGVTVAAWDAKTEFDPKLVVGGDTVAFTTLEGHRVEIRFLPL